ncbi:Ingression protein fic1 [Fusarium oxysporum f. sp. albedinis]|nr:Ingression protein fic1 [Fusarium oxysporum f. sp. albedinis]
MHFYKNYLTTNLNIIKTPVIRFIAISKAREVFKSSNRESNTVINSNSLVYLNNNITINNTDNKSKDSNKESNSSIGLGD